ncbi:hypothetical protein Barb6_01271 [Bacteroidales bacterium Barb6]|nr:hypothetical protein Barb6_01271 [Bacteroidales bacterium Barb6]
MELMVRNCVACVEAPTVIPSSMVIVSISGPRAVSARRRVTPLSFNRFPKKSIPSRGRPEGTRKQVSSKPTIGKMIFSVEETTLAGFMRMTRSFLVVSRRMKGGCMIGTNAM